MTPRDEVDDLLLQPVLVVLRFFLRRPDDQSSSLSFPLLGCFMGKKKGTSPRLLFLVLLWGPCTLDSLHDCCRSQVYLPSFLLKRRGVVALETFCV